jgi:ubiquinone/menaquinone biosynthesis C-methylase UbiE
VNWEEHHRIIREHFDRLAADYLLMKRRNHYYNQYLIRWCRSLVPPGRKVLDVGCGRGDVLASVRPACGLGIDVSGNMVQQAAADHPDLDFQRCPIEEIKGDGSYDAVLCINMLEYVSDVGMVLDKIHSVLRDNGRVLISTGNPLWWPIFQMASRLKLRIPECQRLFLTSKDLENMLRLHGFEVVYERMALIIPKPIPFFSDLINWVMPRIPLLNLLCSMQLLAARKIPPVRKDYSVSVVIPCHNEAGNIARCIEETRALGTHTELILVDDGSTDRTVREVRPEINPALEVKVISYSPNRGKGHAVQVGFDAARGDILIILDADLTTHPEEIKPLYEAFAAGHAEFVNCTRFVYPQENRAMRFLNYLGNKVFAILVSLVMENRVSDTLCGTKAMFRWDYDHMAMGRDPWGDYDFLFGAAQLRLVIRELPVHYRERTVGVSKMNTHKHTLNLIRMCWHGFWQVKTLQPLPPARVQRPHVPVPTVH